LRRLVEGGVSDERLLSGEWSWKILPKGRDPVFKYTKEDLERAKPKRRRKGPDPRDPRQMALFEEP